MYLKVLNVAKWQSGKVAKLKPLHFLTYFTHKYFGASKTFCNFATSYDLYLYDKNSTD